MKVEREQGDRMRREEWRNKGTGGKKGTEERLKHSRNEQVEDVESSSCMQTPLWMYINAYSTFSSWRKHRDSGGRLNRQRWNLPGCLVICSFAPPSQRAAVDVLWGRSNPPTESVFRTEITVEWSGMSASNRPGSVCNAAQWRSLERVSLSLNWNIRF